ncbi:hypothetical protein ACFSC3_01590 [Sphingomonas floccifaciens]|uniref:Alpha/beta hydrolase n=1 Tax=Sphingomonas floccifaciens TaxID=1844115 RepID=A0ABW4N8R2_9SPHN
MTLRSLLAAAALLAAPAVQAADTAPPSTGTETGSRAESGSRATMPRKPERKLPGAPIRPRIVDAPGAALMMIPAAYDIDPRPGAFY